MWSCRREENNLGFWQPWVSLLPMLTEVFCCRTVTSCSSFCMGLIVIWRSATAVSKCCNWTEYGAQVHGAKYSEKNVERVANSPTYLEVVIN